MATQLAAGDCFGLLTATGLRGPRIAGHSTVVCVCSCGGQKAARPTDLRRGYVSSCGCLPRKLLLDRNQAMAIHRASLTTEHKIWAGMRDRCLNTKGKYYPRYGGRGITICNRWSDFRNFLADMGPLPSSRHTIDRIDNDGNYEPSNCRWATWRQQENNRSTSRRITLNGITRTVSEWAIERGVNVATVFNRLRLGFDPARALSKEDFRGGRPELASLMHEQRVMAGRRSAEVRWGSKL